MLWLERQIVAALPTTDEPATRAAIERFVDTSLRAMPEHLRLGITGESLVLGAWLRGRGPDPDAETVRRAVAGWETSSISVIRQYARLFTSLVLFAEQEHLGALERASA
jgi:hypothetical protein